jgi:Na+-translocating ferredoxin:NAD+ oxidoreductase RnfC subunit
VPVGTPFRDAIELAGGASVADPVVLIGGAMMGRYCDDLSQPIAKTTGGLIVLPRDHSLIARYTKTWDQVKRIGASACDQCVFCTFFCPRYLLGHPIEPHAAMRSLGFNLVGEPNVIGTLFCCECNLCTMMAGPEDLDPKNVCSTNKHRLMSEGRKWDVQADPNRAQLHLDNRRVPIARLTIKLGLHHYTNQGPLIGNGHQPRRVVLPLKQHVGAPAEPAVKVNDTVNIGDVIARPPQDALGALIHAPIDGRVVEIGQSMTIAAT